MGNAIAWCLLGFVSCGASLASALIVQGRLEAMLLSMISLGFAFLAGGWLRRVERASGGTER